mgnify:CR=1 FL=1
MEICNANLLKTLAKRGFFLLLKEPRRRLNFVLDQRTQKIGFENDSFELMKVSAEEIAKHKKRIVDSATLHLIG